jgi:SAM-dependent methyltransferase
MYDKVIADLRYAYNLSAPDRQQSTVSDWKLQERQAFLDLLQREEKIALLEIGAGTGKDSKFFQDNGMQVISTDLSPEMVQLCRDKGLEAYKMDFKNLAFPNENFDAIYALNCLLHVPKNDLPEILDILNKLLKPTGLFFMSVYGGLETEGVWEKDYHQPKRFFSTYSDDNLLANVTRIFELVDFKTTTPPAGDDSDLHAQRFILRKI